MKIILDAMGGDHAPLEPVKGAIRASREFSTEVILVGNEDEILKVLEQEGELQNKLLTIKHTDEVISMEDSANAILKEKKNSSLGLGISMLSKGEGDALVSAGNTGALLTGSTLFIKRIKGIRRAALAPIMPTKTGGLLLIDGGANTDCTEEYLAQFAIMGSIYYKQACNKESPRVGLLNNGAEEGKGNTVTKEAYRLLKIMADNDMINFCGNIESRDVPNGVCDVLVTDGFTGNIFLKTYEGVALYIAGNIKNMFYKNFKTKISALFLKKELDDFKKSMDYKEVGGAPLLGIKKPVIKAHGSSDYYAIRSAIMQAIQYASSGAIESIEQSVEAILQKDQNNGN